LYIVAALRNSPSNEAYNSLVESQPASSQHFPAFLSQSRKGRIQAADSSTSWKDPEQVLHVGWLPRKLKTSQPLKSPIWTSYPRQCKYALWNAVLITSLLLSLMKECHHVQVHLHNVPRGYRQVLVYLPIALQRQSRKQLVQTPDAETTLPVQK
jgi:hypothetical protein